MEKVLVTGGCGLIGQHICSGLLKKGYEVIAIDREESGYNDRSIDIDILFYDDKIINDEQDGLKLIIPHKLVHERAFMLVPMLEIAPSFIHPIIKKSISDIYDELDDTETVCLYGTRLI